MPVFHVAIVEMPTRKQIEEEDALEKLLYYSQEPIIAKDKQSAGFQAVAEFMKTDKGKDVKTDRLGVVAYPF